MSGEDQLSAFLRTVRSDAELQQRLSLITPVVDKLLETTSKVADWGAEAARISPFLLM